MRDGDLQGRGESAREDGTRGGGHTHLRLIPTRQSLDEKSEEYMIDWEKGEDGSAEGWKLNETTCRRECESSHVTALADAFGRCALELKGCAVANYLGFEI